MTNESNRYDPQKWVENDLERARQRRRPWTPYAIGAVLVAIALFTLAEIVSPAPDERNIASILPVFLPLLIVTDMSPFARGSWSLSAAPASLDEREELAVMRATARAHRATLALIAAMFVWFWLASLNGWPLPRTPLDWSALAFAVLAFGATLPVLFAELAVPLPPPGDDLED